MVEIYTSTFPEVWTWFFQLWFSDFTSSSSSMLSPTVVEVPPQLPAKCRGPWGEPDCELLCFEDSPYWPWDIHKFPRATPDWFAGWVCEFGILRVWSLYFCNHMKHIYQYGRFINKQHNYTTSLDSLSLNSPANDSLLHHWLGHPLAWAL